MRQSDTPVFQSILGRVVPRDGLPRCVREAGGQPLGLRQWLCRAIAGLHFPDGVGLSVVDGLPMPLCSLRRAPRWRLFRGEAAYGHCAARDMRHYGFRGHVLASDDGLILAFGVAAANVDECAMLLGMSASATTYVLGDK